MGWTDHEALSWCPSLPLTWYLPNKFQEETNLPDALPPREAGYLFYNTTRDRKGTNGRFHEFHAPHFGLTVFGRPAAGRDLSQHAAQVEVGSHFCIKKHLLHVCVCVCFFCKGDQKENHNVFFWGVPRRTLKLWRFCQYGISIEEYPLGGTPLHVNHTGGYKKWFQLG